MSCQTELKAELKYRCTEPPAMNFAFGSAILARISAVSCSLLRVPRKATTMCSADSDM